MIEEKRGQVPFRTCLTREQTNFPAASTVAGRLSRTDSLRQFDG